MKRFTLSLRIGILSSFTLLVFLLFMVVQQQINATSTVVEKTKVEKLKEVTSSLDSKNEAIKRQIKKEASLKLKHSEILSLRRKVKGATLYISKNKMKLYLITIKHDTLFSSPIACGKRLGNKQKRGDMRTPEGTFSAVKIKNASWWSHDFKDGKGVINGAYGPYFIALKTGWNGIGIHGTHLPSSIGTHATEGCIRLPNRKVRELVELIKTDLPLKVVISPEKEEKV